MPKQWKELWREKKKSILRIGIDKWLLILLAGVLLVLSSIPFDKEKSTKEEKGGKETIEKRYETQETDSEDYEKQLEERLEGILACVEGAGRVKVMITLEASSTMQVASQGSDSKKEIAESDAQGGSRITTESQKEEEKIYTTNEEGESVPFIEKEWMPQVEGVVIVAQGGGDAATAGHLTNAAKAVLGIEVNKITVCKMKE